MNSFAEINQALDKFIIPLDSKSSYMLDRIENLLVSLGNPQEKFKTVHIAGTSGKTSTAYYITGMLKAAGYKVGLTVSPHIEEVNERVQIGLVPLSEKEFCCALTEYLVILNTLSIKLTYYELFISFAYWYFAKISVDYAVVEVGLGGLFDGTNVIKRPDKICVITDIGFDHTAILGNNLEEITKQKAGIIQQNNQVFTYKRSKNINQQLQKRAQVKNAQLNYLEETLDANEGNMADFQKRNWLLAKKVAEFIFKTDNKSLSEQEWTATTETVIPGRLEIVSYKGKSIILDGAHNSQKMQTFINAYRQKFPDKSTSVLLAVAESKDLHLKEMAEQINKISKHIIITTFISSQDLYKKSTSPQAIAKYFPGSTVSVKTNLDEALKELLNSKADALLVTGSLYLIGSVRKLLKSKP